MHSLVTFVMQLQLNIFTKLLLLMMQRSIMGLLIMGERQDMAGNIAKYQFAGNFLQAAMLCRMECLLKIAMFALGMKKTFVRKHCENSGSVQSKISCGLRC